MPHFAQYTSTPSATSQAPANPRVWEWLDVPRIAGKVLAFQQSTSPSLYRALQRYQALHPHLPALQSRCYLRPQADSLIVYHGDDDNSLDLWATIGSLPQPSPITTLSSFLDFAAIQLNIYLDVATSITTLNHRIDPDSRNRALSSLLTLPVPQPTEPSFYHPHYLVISFQPGRPSPAGPQPPRIFFQWTGQRTPHLYMSVSDFNEWTNGLNSAQDVLAAAHEILPMPV